jgi:hypothetical protein
MIPRAVAVWFLILVLAVVNGAVRDGWLSPRLGETVGRGLSSLSLSALVFLTTYLSIRWIRPATAGQAWEAGWLWLGLTLGFEFLSGHFLFRKPWPALLEDYNVLRGRIWVLVLIVTVASPAWTARLRHVLER